MHIGIDREARRRQQPAQRGDVVAIEAEAVGELEPARDAAVAFPLAVMVDAGASATRAAARGSSQRAIRLASFTGIMAW